MYFTVVREANINVDKGTLQTLADMSYSITVDVRMVLRCSVEGKSIMTAKKSSLNPIWDEDITMYVGWYTGKLTLIFGSHSMLH